MKVTKINLRSKFRIRFNPLNQRVSAFHSYLIGIHEVHLFE